MLPVLGRMVGALVLVLVSFLFLLFLLFAALPFDVNCVERLARPLTFLDRTAIRRQIVRRGNTNKVQKLLTFIVNYSASRNSSTSSSGCMTTGRTGSTGATPTTGTGPTCAPPRCRFTPASLRLARCRRKIHIPFTNTIICSIPSYAVPVQSCEQYYMDAVQLWHQ